MNSAEQRRPYAIAQALEQNFHNRRSTGLPPHFMQVCGFVIPYFRSFPFIAVLFPFISRSVG
jgi:hypothetical protein